MEIDELKPERTPEASTTQVLAALLGFLIVIVGTGFSSMAGI